MKVNKLKEVKVAWLIFCLSVFLSGLEAGNCLAVEKKNQNKVDDFFEREIPDKASVDKDMEQFKEGSIEGVRNNNLLKLLPGEENIEAESSNLINTPLTKAENKSLQIRGQNNDYLNRMHVDLKDPGILNHKKDMDNIAKGTKKLTDKLFASLKNIGIDCKQTQGTKAVDPEVYIEIEQEKAGKEVVYKECWEYEYVKKCDYPSKDNF